ncbi:hypothetical protein [Alkalihalophilus pseudofirmus]|uniref:hypothetical protein n=1 Tax=Alkalihalophilus pseudofirmus TaxID=79885 RepID=UPI000A6B7658
MKLVRLAKLEQERAALNARIKEIEKEIITLQTTCKHTFSGDSYSLSCIKCGITRVLYY